MNGIQNGYKGISVEIISYTKHPAKIIWDMLKQTWISLHDVDYDPNNETVKKFITDSLSRRLNPVPQETILIQAIFKGISRVNLAQLTRHRGWIFNSESQMPQPVNHNVIIPLNIVNSPFYERAKKLIEESQKLYDDMTKGNENKETTNIPYQDARYLLIHGQTADISASFTLPQLVNAVGMRFENNTHDEINYTFRLLVKELRKAIEEDTELDNLDKMVYNTLLNNCDVFGANRKVGTCYDAMFGNSFKRFPDANEYVTKATEECLFDYKKLAWYEELKRIYKEEPELLLPGEKEMIESWGD
jgi:thymidylate synthase ThyX